MHVLIENWEAIAAVLKVIGSVAGAYFLARLRGTLRFTGKEHPEEETVPLAPISDLRQDLLRENARLRKRNTFLEGMAAGGATVIKEADINAMQSQLRELRIMMQDILNNPAA